MNLYHHQTKRFLYENDRSMWYLLKDSYRTTTYRFVVDNPPLWVHPDQRIIVKTTDQIYLPLSTYLLHRLEHYVAKSLLCNLVVHHKLHDYLSKQDSVSSSKRIYFENDEGLLSASSRRKPCNNISLCRFWWWTHRYYIPSLPWSISSSLKHDRSPPLFTNLVHVAFSKQLLWYDLCKSWVFLQQFLSITTTEFELFQPSPPRDHIMTNHLCHCWWCTHHSIKQDLPFRQPSIIIKFGPRTKQDRFVQQSDNTTGNCNFQAPSLRTAYCSVFFISATTAPSIDCYFQGPSQHAAYRSVFFSIGIHHPRCCLHPQQHPTSLPFDDPQKQQHHFNLDTIYSLDSQQHRHLLLKFDSQQQKAFYSLEDATRRQHHLLLWFTTTDTVHLSDFQLSGIASPPLYGTKPSSNFAVDFLKYKYECKYNK